MADHPLALAMRPLMGPRPITMELMGIYMRFLNSTQDFYEESPKEISYLDPTTRTDVLTDIPDFPPGVADGLFLPIRYEGKWLALYMICSENRVELWDPTKLIPLPSLEALARGIRDTVEAKGMIEASPEPPSTRVTMVLHPCWISDHPRDVAADSGVWVCKFAASLRSSPQANSTLRTMGPMAARSFIYDQLTFTAFVKNIYAREELLLGQGQRLYCRSLSRFLKVSATITTMPDRPQRPRLRSSPRARSRSRSPISSSRTQESDAPFPPSYEEATTQEDRTYPSEIPDISQVP